VRWACRAVGIEAPPAPIEAPSPAALAAAEFVLGVLEAEPPDLRAWAEDRERWLIASEGAALVDSFLADGPLAQFTAMMRDAAAMTAIRTTERLDPERQVRVLQLAPLYLHTLELVAFGRRALGLAVEDAHDLDVRRMREHVDGPD
jgi:hypothetical protein